MGRPKRKCATCIHCRQIGDEKAGTLRVWCRLGIWEKLSDRFPGSRFVYRSLRRVRMESHLLKWIARFCPYYNSTPDEWPVRYLPPPR